VQDTLELRIRAVALAPASLHGAATPAPTASPRSR
jgi:hypothetical protein